MQHTGTNYEHQDTPLPHEQRSTFNFCTLCNDWFSRNPPRKKIFVTVSGGVAEVMDDTVPEGIEVEIIDFDNINAGDDFPSEEARAYSVKKGWA